MKTRNHTIDFVRTFAAFAVVCIHSNYGKTDVETINLFKIATRWAVPFFFIVSGYFLSNLTKEFPQKIIIRLISIHITASIIFLGIKIIDKQSLNIGLETIINGAYFHLWFIGSMILGTIFLWYAHQIKINKYLIFISILILTVTTFTDGYDNLFEKKISYMPFLISIPFIHFGQILRTKNKIISKKLLLVLIIILFSFQYIESLLLNLYTNNNIYQTLSISTIIFAIVLFKLITTTKLKKENYITKIGKKYSLFIYLFHPILILILSKTSLTHFNFNNGIQPFLVFILTLILGKLISIIHPKLFKILNGELISKNKSKNY